MFELRSVQSTFVAVSALALPGLPALGQFQELAPPLNGDNTYVEFLNPSGLAVGYGEVGPAESAILWRPSGGGYTSEILEAPDGYFHTGANSIAPSGAIAGYALDEFMETARAVVWTETSPGSGYNPTLVEAPVIGQFAGAYGINSARHAVGFTENDDAESAAVVWKPAGIGYDAFYLPTTATWNSAAIAINEQGRIAGYRHKGINVDGVVWTPAAGGGYTAKTVISDKTSLITSMSRFGTGTGVYDGDKPLVMAYFDGDYYAFNLPTSDSNGNGASNAVNSYDVIVGTAKDAATSQAGDEAAVWLPTDSYWEFLNLDQWLNVNHPALGAAWTLTEAVSINDDHLVVGRGFYDPDGAGGVSASERSFALDISSLVPDEPLFSDFNDDGNIDALDLDLLSAEIQNGISDLFYDLTGDELVDLGDLTHQVEFILGTYFGDADLDGDVDLSDLASLAASYGQSPRSWAQGDFDSDGDVDLNDLSNLAAHYGQGEAQAMADFQALAAVPEPGTIGLATIAAAMFLRRRARR